MGCSKFSIFLAPCMSWASKKKNKKGKSPPIHRDDNISTIPAFPKFWTFLTLMLQVTERAKRREYTDCHSVIRLEKIKVLQRLRGSKAHFINKRKSPRTALNHTRRRRKNKNPVRINPVSYKNRTNLLFPACSLLIPKYESFTLGLRTATAIPG